MMACKTVLLHQKAHVPVGFDQPHIDRRVLVLAWARPTSIWKLLLEDFQGFWQSPQLIDRSGMLIQEIEPREIGKSYVL
jgi:hypothetical protein